MARVLTDAAIIPLEFVSTSSSRRSTTTRRPTSGAWTSSSARRRATTTRRAPCSRHSTSRSGSEGQKPSNAESQENVMAKKSSIEKNNRRQRLAKKFGGKRSRLKEVTRDKNLPMEERFAAALKLAQLPRNSSRTRIRNRCEMSG